MLKRLHVRNFTVFEEADFEFSPGLNVVVGTNGTGKSHVLKLGYAVGKIEYPTPTIPLSYQEIHGVLFYATVETSLKELFLSESLGHLIRRESVPHNAFIKVEYFSNAGTFECTIRGEERSLSVDKMPPSETINSNPKANIHVFIPPKEVLTFFSWLPSIYDLRTIEIDQTYPILCKQLALPLLRKLDTNIQSIIKKLEEIMNGKIGIQNNRFYLYPETGEPIEINLVAEGIRKFGMLAQLLANGSLTPKTTLFWDESEANLNPALLRQLAALLVQLAAQGFQIILATHSLFLMKEFHILAQRHPQARVRYFGLNERGEKGVEVTTTDDLEQLPDIVALDAEMDLADRFQEILDAEDTNDN